MQVSVQWGGVDVQVELSPVETSAAEWAPGGNIHVKPGTGEGLLRGTFGNPPITIDRSTRRIDGIVSWEASVMSPEVCGEDHAVRPRGVGDTAQEAVDALSVRLRDLAGWTYTALHPGQKVLHYAADPRDATACNAVGSLRYTSDLPLFNSVIGILPTCDECVARRYKRS